MSEDWYEVWVDDGLEVPYVLLVLPDGKRTGGIVIVDPKEQDRVIHEAGDYDSAKLWLWEDSIPKSAGECIGATSALFPPRSPPAKRRAG